MSFDESIWTTGLAPWPRAAKQDSKDPGDETDAPVETHPELRALEADLTALELSGHVRRTRRGDE